MRDRHTSTVRELIISLQGVEDELRAARRAADPDRLSALVRDKRVTLRELRRRLPPRRLRLVRRPTV
jgi:hypothetical protein